MARPIVDQFGTIIVGSVDSLSRDDLRDWMREKLHQGPDYSGRGQSPSYVLAGIYWKLDRFTREDMQTCMIAFMDDMATNPESSWRGEAGDELLMLVEPVLLQSPRKENAVDILMHLAELPELQSSTTEPGAINLHWRSLQTLVGLRTRLNSKFWVEQYQRSEGKPCIPVVLEGLATISLDAAFDWLTTITWSEANDAVIAIFPSLLEDYGTARVTTALEHTLPCLVPAGFCAILRLCFEEEVPITLGWIQSIKWNPTVQTAVMGFLEDLLADFPEDEYRNRVVELIARFEHFVLAAEGQAAIADLRTRNDI